VGAGGSSPHDSSFFCNGMGGKVVADCIIKKKNYRTLY